jgi:mono/diheme cytochrome c family protein
MNQINDLTLTPPISPGWIISLLFTAFTLHLLFVLLMLGTAIIAFVYFIDARWRYETEIEWNKTTFKSFTAHKSLAVVLGIGPLLLIQVGFTIPFFSAINLFAPYWLLIIGLLIAAFLAMDLLSHLIDKSRYFNLFVGIIGLSCLLAVPGIFVLMLVTTENSSNWLMMLSNGYEMGSGLAVHWVFRYGHILGAAIVFGAVFHYFFTSRNSSKKRRVMLYWMANGILFQVVDGSLLLISLPHKPDVAGSIFVITGIISAMIFLWWVFSLLNSTKSLSLPWAALLLMVVLVGMLLIRQELQSRSVVPLVRGVERNREQYEDIVNTYHDTSLAEYADFTSVEYYSGKVIYERACAFCHGREADGDGPEAKHLKIPPADIAAIRSTRPYLHRILMVGVPGSGMPYFAHFLENRLENTIDFLHEHYQVLAPPPPIPVHISDSILAKAEETYTETCSACHGMDGGGTSTSKGFRPPPPDFRYYVLAPKRSFQIISDGYPGTMMFAFEDDIDEHVRWGLVAAIYSLRKDRQALMAMLPESEN